MLESLTNFFYEPAKVWHVFIVLIPIMITLSNMQRQMNAQGKILNIIWNKIDPDIVEPY